ncbi:MAG TPA: FAD-binding oxidoreductase [Candidatus Limnocylindria bacterium]|nr:FAD-binding oxidoreductase [Candidatus Limnocylindria bacterium]
MDAAITLRVAPDASDLDTFAAQLRGTLIRPDDDRFDATAGIWNTAFAARPAAIVRVADAQDVAAAIAFACRNDYEIAVRSGGHSLAGHSTGDGVLVIDTRELRGLHVDLAEGVVWAGAGLTAGNVTAALAPHGMAVPFGDTASVGIGGITLGGGIGFLARKYGLTVDSLVAVEIVTADGEVRMASATEHPDLFWALRGGGGNFGIVTRFCYRLSPVGEAVLAGALFMPATRDVLRSLVPIATSAPEELTVIANVMHMPPLPFVPEDSVGTPTVMLLFVYAGDPADGQAAIAPFRAVATPIAEVVQPMPYAGIYELTREAEAPGPHTVRSLFLDAVDDASVDAIMAALETAPAGTMVQVRGFGGALSRVPADATAFPHRAAAAQVTIINMFAEPDATDAALAWNRALYAALEPAATGVYVNFLEDEGESRVRAAYPNGTYERLAAIKRRYDRYNVFRRNQNIRPA